MARKPSKTSLNRALDRLISLHVRERNRHLCEVCGRPANQVHHVVTRANRRVRWLPANLVSICGGCHLFAEGNPLAFAKWFQKNRPEDFAYLSDPENLKPITRSVADLQDLRDELRNAA